MSNEKHHYGVDGERYSYDATLSERGQGGQYDVEIEILADDGTVVKRERRRFQATKNGTSAFEQAYGFARARIAALVTELECGRAQ